MQFVDVEDGKLTHVATFVTDSNGDGLATAVPTFVMKCLAPNTSANFNKFYDATNEVWSNTPVSNLITQVVGAAGAFLWSFDKSDIGPLDTEYLVKFDTDVGIIEGQSFIYRYKSNVESLLKRIANIVSPAREEIHRISNSQLEMRYFDSQDVEVARFTVLHNATGTQPEQTKEQTL